MSIASTATGILGGMAQLGLLVSACRPSMAAPAWTTSALGLASEELEYCDTSLRVIVVSARRFELPDAAGVGNRGTEAALSVPQAQGRLIGGTDLTEPSAGSDARGIQATAIKHGDRYAERREGVDLACRCCDHFLVIAWTDLAKKQQRNTSGLSAFMVERSFPALPADP